MPTGLPALLWCRARDQAFCRIPSVEAWGFLNRTIQQFIVLVRSEDDQHSLFIGRFVETLHERMAVRIGVYLAGGVVI